MKKKLRDLTKPATVGDLDDLSAQIVTAITKALEDYPTKEELKVLASKEDLKALEKKIDKLDYDVSDVRHRVIDLEVDTVSRKDFNAHLSG